ncbi:hypothetical protein D1614_03720 [Maribellus luteus]|uniref:DUF4848 domain-containing protein n=1 Tax=Maribellus luteus TaxID=2305463 RepID=A0A399T6T2_9BACT|nr:hypothetical protein [Maribellus luteus]RIJ49861.1 hypothetical protein D1614_03720 [Maribellus luteus]
MKKLVWFAMVVAGLSIFNACEKSDELTGPNDEKLVVETVKPDVSSEDGYLVFKNIEAVDSIILLLSRMTTLEIEAWEKSMDIISARSEFEQLFSEYEKLNSYEEFLTFKNKNHEKLKFKDLVADDHSIDYPYATIHFLPVLNNKGLVKIGQSLIKYTKENQILIKNGDINALNNLHKNIEDNNVVVSKTLKSVESNELVVDNFPDYDPLNRLNTAWHMVEGVSKRRMINELIFETWREYLGVEGVSSKWRRGYFVYFQQRAHKKTWTGWNSYTTRYYFDEMKLRVGNNETWFFNPNPYITSPERKTGRVKMYTYYTPIQYYTLYGIMDFLERPQISFSVKTSCQGFGADKLYEIKFEEQGFTLTNDWSPNPSYYN